METAFNLPDSIAVVTGASSGLGRRMALDIATRGATVIGIARREEVLQQVAAEMRRSSPTSGYVACDVSDTDRCASVLSVARLAPVARALVPRAYRRGVKSFTPS